MGFSYSKVNTYWDCPFKYRLVYIDKIEARPNTDANCPFYTGTAIHEGIEKRSIDAAVDNYKSNFDFLDKSHEVEIEKIKAILVNAIAQIPEGEYEYKLVGDDGFIGFIDCLVKVDDGVYDILDFKHTNNVSGYLESPQVMLYKYYFEKLTGYKVRDMYYVFIPKYKGDDIDDIRNNYSKTDIRFEKVEYDQSKVDVFMNKKRLMDLAKVFEKKRTVKCKWCDYYKFCSSNGADLSELTPKSIASLRGEDYEESLF